MKIKIGEILNSKEIFEKIISEKLPFKTLINLSRLVDRISNEIKIIEEERIKLVKEYGTEKENGVYSIDYNSDNALIFAEKLNELFNVEIEISDVEKFNQSDFENLQLNLPEYLQLKPFLSE